MQGSQKVVKGFALALAGLLILLICSGIIGGLSLVGMMVWGDGLWQSGQTETWRADFAETEIKKLDVGVGASKVVIRRAEEEGESGMESAEQGDVAREDAALESSARGNVVRVETNNSFVTVEAEGTTLKVREDAHGFLGWNWRWVGEVTIYVREGAEFDEVKLEVGAGTLSVDELTASLLDLDLGAGTVGLRLTAGTMRVNVGAGEADIDAIVKNGAKIDVGAGRLDMRLRGEQDDYRFAIDKGIGSIKLNGQNLADGEIYGSGDVLIDVNAGVGAVDIVVAEGK